MSSYNLRKYRRILTHKNHFHDRVGLHPGAVADVATPAVVEFGEVSTIHALGFFPIEQLQRRNAEWHSRRTPRAEGMEGAHMRANPVSPGELRTAMCHKTGLTLS